MSSEPHLVLARELEGWTSQWDALVDSSPLPSPFMRSWWLGGAGGPHRDFLLVVDDDQLVGGLALEQETRLGLPCLRVMGDGALCPDHMDVLIAPGYADQVIRILRSWLCRSGERLVDLRGIRAGSPLSGALPGSVRRELLALAPFAPLPDSSDGYLAGLPSQFRRNLRRSSARLEAEGVMHRTNRGPDVVPALDDLRRLHRAQWGSRSNFLPVFDRFAAGCLLGMAADEVAVHELVIDESVVATVVVFEVAGRVSLYQSARLTEPRWRDATTVLLSTIVTDACDRGFSEVDFLRGDESYKSRFAPNERQMFRLLAAKGAVGRIAFASKVAAAEITTVAVRAVRAGRMGMARAKP